ncbi:MAG: type II secretion system F family protein [Planctomycetaceae bacterium]|nr:type II secretion system F family protein [Planctomycetaceae bacterium]
MPEFAYKARSAGGDQITGLLTANSKREALNMLSERSLFPLQVDDAKDSSTPFAFSFKFSKRIKAEVISQTLTQLSDLLLNGVSILEALKLMSQESTQPDLKEVLTDVHDRMVEGSTLEDAVLRHPHVFDELTVSMIRAGSEGAFLEDALKRTADFLELQEEMKARVKGAMMYPAFLLVVGVLAVTGILVFLVPKFEPLFKSLEKKGGLPGPTVALLAISDFLGSFYGLILLALLAGGVIGFKKWLQTDSGKLKFDRWRLQIPVAGTIFLGSAVARFTRVLGTLLQNGVPLLRALEISKDSSGSKVLSLAIAKSAENVTSGETLSKPLSQCGLIPNDVMAMIRIAEESNNLENVLINISEGIDRKTNRKLDSMVKLLEPIMLIVMGIVILFILVALLMPIIEASTSV